MNLETEELLSDALVAILALALNTVGKNNTVNQITALRYLSKQFSDMGKELKDLADQKEAEFTSKA